jgi:hypothetical protein
MKWFGWALLSLMAASPAWAARKISVEQLKDLLVSLQQAKKTDAEVASELMQVELTEQLTRSTLNRVAPGVPGPLSSVQIYVLEIRSAVFLPPASDLPSAPAPDAATQRGILDKAIDYATTTYAQLPHLTAIKTTYRFEEKWPDIDSPTITAGVGALSAEFDLDKRQLGQVIHFSKSTEIPVDLEQGAERDQVPADKTHWGENGQIALRGKEPDLAEVLKEARAAGKIDWLRWEKVNGVQTAVYAFAVGKKETHYTVDYCCFRNERMTSMGLIGSSALSEHSASSDTSDWVSRKITVPYHGEIFVDPETGIVVRLVNQAEFKPSEDIRQEDRRIDFERVTVGAKTLVLPVREMISAVTINKKTISQTSAVRISSSELFTKTCNTLFTAEYKGYQLAGGTSPAPK